MNCQLYVKFKLLPARSLAPVPTVTMYVVLAPRFESGVYVITFPLQLKLPVVAGKVENADSTDALFIASLKVTVILVVTGSLVPVGVFPITTGAVCIRDCSELPIVRGDQVIACRIHSTCSNSYIICGVVTKVQSRCIGHIIPAPAEIPCCSRDVEKADSADAWFIGLLKFTEILAVTGTFVPVGAFPTTSGGIGDVSMTFSSLTLSM